LAGGWARNPLWKTARAVPSLDLRFAENKTLGDAYGGGSPVTFTRASSGTYVGSDGLLKTATTNEARFDHNPTTGESLGLLVEEARTNLLLQSEDFLTTWGTNSSPTRTANTSVAPDGNITADTIGSTVTGSYVSQTVTFTGDGDKAYFCFLKAGTSISTIINLRDITAGSNRGSATVTWAGGVPSVSVSGGSLLGVKSFPNGWYQIAILASGVIAANTNQFRIQPDASAGTGNVIIWGFQAENGAFPTSYIPTTTATVTRAADVASITGANFSSFYNQAEGTLYGDSIFAANTNTRLVSANTNATANRVMITRGTGSNGNFNLVVSDAGAIQVNSLVLGSNIPVGSSNKVAAAYKAADFAGSFNGLTVATQQTGTVPLTMTQLTIGNGESLTTNTMTGTIKRLTYWPTRLANTTLQAISQL
jgi:hypothetical protein